jgi:hypothetical protein
VAACSSRIQQRHADLELSILEFFYFFPSTKEEKKKKKKKKNANFRDFCISDSDRISISNLHPEKRETERQRDSRQQTADPAAAAIEVARQFGTSS